MSVCRHRPTVCLKNGDERTLLFTDVTVIRAWNRQLLGRASEADYPPKLHFSSARLGVRGAQCALLACSSIRRMSGALSEWKSQSLPPLGCR